MENKTFSITAYGKLKDNNFKWNEWYEDAKQFILSTGYVYNYVGIDSKSMKSGKIMNAKKYERKVLDAFQNNEQIKHISLFSLPIDYESASFDYDIMLVRNDEFISLIMNKSDYSKEILEQFTFHFKKYFESAIVELYEMDRYESPLLYAAKVNELSSFQTLNIAGVIQW